MSLRRSVLSLSVAACALAGAAPHAASAATPRVSGYAISGGLTLWTQPDGEGCVAQQPTITATGSSAGLATKLYFLGLAPTYTGISVPWPGSLLRSSDDDVVYVQDGPLTISAPQVLGFYGAKGSKASIGFKNIKTKGRYTVAAWYSYPAKLGSFSYNAIKVLPTKSIPFAVVAKPAGSCTVELPGFLIQ